MYSKKASTINESENSFSHEEEDKENPLLPSLAEDGDAY